MNHGGRNVVPVEILPTFGVIVLTVEPIIQRMLDAIIGIGRGQKHHRHDSMHSQGAGGAGRGLSTLCTPSGA